jgi:hypothetical protein
MIVYLEQVNILQTITIRQREMATCPWFKLFASSIFDLNRMVKIFYYFFKVFSSSHILPLLLTADIYFHNFYVAMKVRKVN